VGFDDRFIVEALFDANSERVEIVKQRDQVVGIDVIGIVMLTTGARGPNPFCDLMDHRIGIEALASGDS
jgi:hypothetical protein